MSFKILKTTYSDLLQTQKTSERVFLLGELSPVITLGRRTDLKKDLFFAPEFYADKGVEILKVSRGGLATYHGPGQWVLFPGFEARELLGDSRAIKKLICSLLEIAQSVSEEMGVSAEVLRGDCLGVWSKKGKLASVGVSIENGRITHGLSINGYQTEQSFVGMRPCGLDAQVDYLLNSPKGFEDLAAMIQVKTQQVFGLTGLSNNVISEESVLLKMGSIGA